MEYLVRRARQKPELQGKWDGPAWRDAEIADLASFHPASSDHRPKTQAKILYDDQGLYVHFHVQDRYVVCTRSENQSLASKDSCVEVYLQPDSPRTTSARSAEDRADVVRGLSRGYFNFEMNCGGALLLFYVLDPIRSDPGIFKHKFIVPQSLIDTMRIYHSLPRTLEKEIVEPVEWSVEYLIPNSLFEHYVGKLPPAGERRWRGTFHKCADDSSHPHWASWSPIGEALNFHVPKYFGDFRFEA